MWAWSRGTLIQCFSCYISLLSVPVCNISYSALTVVHIIDSIFNSADLTITGWKMLSVEVLIHALNLLYGQFCQVLCPQTSHKCSCSNFFTHSWLKPHPHIDNLSIVMALGRQPLVQTGKKCLPTRNGSHECERTAFMHRRIEVAHPVPTKVFLKLSPEMAMLSTPFGCIHPLPPFLSFLLKQNLHISKKMLRQVTSQDEILMRDISSYIWERGKQDVWIAK